MKYSIERKTDSTTGKKSKSKSQIPAKAPKDRNPTQRQSAKADGRVTHDDTQDRPLKA
jgi:hypothetical protein